MTWCHFGNRSCFSPALPWEMSASDSAKSPSCTHQSVVPLLQNHWGHVVHSPRAPPMLSCALPWPYIITTPVKYSHMAQAAGSSILYWLLSWGGNLGVTDAFRVKCLFPKNWGELNFFVLMKCCSTSCVLKNALSSTLPEVPVFFSHPSLPPKVVLLNYRTALAVSCSALLQDVIKGKSTIKTLLNI